MLLKRLVKRSKSIRVANHRFVELPAIILIAIIVLAAKGANGEGQRPLFGAIVGEYIEETSASILSAVEYGEGTPVTDANTLIAVGGGLGRGGEAVVPSPDLATVQESSLIAILTASEDYIAHGGFTRSQVVEYTVQDGDLLSFIASDYGVTVNSILWANKISNADAIRPGQVLRIPPISGVVHKVQKGDTVDSLAKKYGAESDKILAFNDLPASGVLVVGDELVIPDGKMPQSAAAKQNIAIQAAAAKSSQKFSYLPNLGDYFMRPATGFIWGIIHGRNGVDVANSCGTPIFAAADGTAAIADATGWNGGYGKYVKLVHPNGTETLYAHLKELKISLGGAVSKGQILGLMGTTGRSTGCHLHFEVHGAQNLFAKY